MERIKVREIMGTDVKSIDRALGVDVALQVMADRRVRRLPVISDTGRLIGIVTREDARRALERARGGLVPEPPPAVNDAMAHVVHTVGPDEPLARAARTMYDQRVGALPVVQDDAVVGIITESDIFKYLASHLEITE